MKIGKYFSLEELTVSQEAARRGILNRPGPEEMANLQRLVRNVLDPLRELIQQPIIVTSAFRSRNVNSLIGGARNSQHVLGQAADIIVPSMSPTVVVALIANSRIPFDQVIDEFESWTHVSWSPRNRRERLEARRENGKTTYRRIA
jgi:hypothetical protein